MTAFAAVALVAALLLALLAWGVANSLRLDRAAASARAGRAAERELDAAIEAAVREHGGAGCGHDHDPSELTVPDDPCERDGHGAGCTHSCETCVLATMQRAASRPSPGPRPSPAPPIPRAGADSQSAGGGAVSP